MPLTLHAEVRGSNPLGSTDKLPANDEEIENSSRHAEDAVQQPCHNPSESFELLDKLIARKMPICGKPIPCGDFLAWEHLVAPWGWLVLHAQPSSASQSSLASSPSPTHSATPRPAPQETSSHPRPPGIR